MNVGNGFIFAVSHRAAVSDPFTNDGERNNNRI